MKRIFLCKLFIFNELYTYLYSHNMIQLNTKRIQLRMKELGLNENDLAEILAMSQSNLSRTLHNQLQIKIDRIVDLSKALNLEPDDIVINNSNISIRNIEHADSIGSYNTHYHNNELKELLINLSKVIEKISKTL